MAKTETIFVLWDAALMGNGLVYSVFRKVKLMEDVWGYRPLILSCKHNPGFRKAVEWLKRDGRADNMIGLNKGSRILNVYDYFQNSYAPGLPIKDRPEGGVSFEYSETGEKSRALYYDDWGYLNKVCHYSRKAEGYIPLEDYYTTGGKICIRACYDFAYGENALNKLIVCDDYGNAVNEFADEAGLAALCLERLTLDGSKEYVIVMENDGVSKPFNLAGRPNVTLCAELHNVFLENPYDLNSEPWFPYKNLCGNRAAFGAIVMLTESERGDFAAKYGASSNLFVIPHPYPYKIVKTDFAKRDRMKAVMVARFDRQKRADLAIDIFAAVVKELPGVTLEIYGFGPLEPAYREQIKALGLSGNVFLMGPTPDPVSVFSGAAVSIMTSDYEGYGITLTESVCNGCPAAAFDIKYGPSEIIRDGETGFLIPRFDKEGFALKLIKYFTDESLQRAMSENCYKDAARFGPEPFLERWYNMLYTIRHNALDNTLDNTLDNILE